MESSSQEWYDWIFFESDIKLKNKQATFEPAYIKPSITGLDKQNFLGLNFKYFLTH